MHLLIIYQSEYLSVYVPTYVDKYSCLHTLNCLSMYTYKLPMYNKYIK